MGVRKICKPKGCRGSPRCDHPWWFDVMHDGKRWRMRVDEFALVRGATEPVTSKQTAERVWEPKFLAEIMAGGDPRVKPVTAPKASEGLTVADFLDRYCTNYVEAEGLRDPVTIVGRLKAVKAVLGNEPVSALEKAEPIQRFKASYRHGRAVATVNRALSALRGAINWGRFQDPPLLMNSPFHRFGVTIRTKDETKRDRRVGADEEKALLDAALARELRRAQVGGRVDARSDHRRAGDLLPARRDAPHPEPTRGLGAASDCDSRRARKGLGEPPRAVRPAGPARADPEAAGQAGAERVRVRQPGRRVPGLVQDRLGIAAAPANGHDTKRAKKGARVDREKFGQIDLHWHDLRHEGACRLLADGVDIRTIQLMLGHADIKQTQRYLNITDEELRKAMTGVWERRRQLKAVGQ